MIASSTMLKLILSKFLILFQFNQITSHREVEYKTQWIFQRVLELDFRLFQKPKTSQAEIKVFIRIPMNFILESRGICLLYYTEISIIVILKPFRNYIVLCIFVFILVDFSSLYPLYISGIDSEAGRAASNFFFFSIFLIFYPAFDVCFYFVALV